MNEKQLELSIVIPLLDEEDSIELLYSSLKEALEGLGMTYEIVVVDDGSTDRSFAVLRDLCEGDPSLKVIRLRRSFGQTAAFSAGFDKAEGEIVVTLDADLQNDPADIPLLLAKIEEGHDVVSGWRKSRQDAFLTRRFPSAVANFLISEVTGVKLHDYGCSLKAYRREVLKNIDLYGELHRFIPALASWSGISLAEVPVAHHPRRFGESKYGLSRTFRVVLDLLTVRFLLSYSTRPIHIFGSLGILASLLGTIILAYLAFDRLILQHPIADRPALLLGILLFVVGVQFITMGLLAELTVRAYHEARSKPTYAVREILTRDDV